MSLLIFIKLKELPNLCKRFTMDEPIDLEAGTEVDLVPVHGGVACMATRAGIAQIVANNEYDSPDGILPKRARAGEGSAVVEIITVCAPALKIPGYTQPMNDKEGATVSSATLANFEKAQLVVPISMLKEHVDSDVRVTPVEDECDQMKITIPTEGGGCDDENTTDTDPEFTGINCTEDGYTDANFDEFIGTLSDKDVDYIEKMLSQVNGTANEGREVLPCVGLSAAPRLSDLKDKHSSVLGDVFHAMDRTKVPVKPI